MLEVEDIQIYLKISSELIVHKVKFKATSLVKSK